MKKLTLLTLLVLLLVQTACIFEGSSVDKVLEVNQDGKLSMEWLWSTTDNPFGEGEIVFTGVSDNIVFLVVEGEVFAISEDAYEVGNRDEHRVDYYEGLSLEDLAPYLE